MGVALWRRVDAESVQEITAPVARPCYRVTAFGEPRTPWRSSVAEAIADAAALNLASWDASQRRHYLAVPVALETLKPEDAS